MFIPPNIFVVKIKFIHQVWLVHQYSNVICFCPQEWEGKIMGIKRSGENISQNVHIIPILGKGGWEHSFYLFEQELKYLMKHYTNVTVCWGFKTFGSLCIFWNLSSTLLFKVPKIVQHKWTFTTALSPMVKNVFGPGFFLQMLCPSKQGSWAHGWQLIQNGSSLLCGIISGLKPRAKSLFAKVIRAIVKVYLCEKKIFGGQWHF